MNHTNPFLGSGEGRNKKFGALKVTAFGVLGLNALGLVALLIQGCRQEPLASKQELANSNPPAAVQVQVTNLAVAAMTNVSVSQNNAPAVVATNAQVAAPSANASYTVVEGDTLCGIARTLHTTVQALMEANPGTEPTKLQIGQKIRVPQVEKVIATSTKAQTSKDGADGERIYTVKSGDYLLKVAGQFGTTVSAIRQANGLRTDRLEVGQKLKLPQNNPGAQPLQPRASLTNGVESV